MTSCCWLVVMDSERFASLIQGIFCGGLNAYCMHIRPLFLRTSGSSGVLKALLLERNGQLSCNPKKKKKKSLGAQPCKYCFAGYVALDSWTGQKMPSSCCSQAHSCFSFWGYRIVVYSFQAKEPSGHRTPGPHACTNLYSMQALQPPHEMACLFTVVGTTSCWPTGATCIRSCLHVQCHTHVQLMYDHHRNRR